MRAFRRFGFALWLALALVAGQQLVALHALGHASEKLSQTDPKPLPAKCGECLAFAQLSAGAASTIADVALVEGNVLPATPLVRDGEASAVLAYRSRAPPALL